MLTHFIAATALALSAGVPAGIDVTVGDKDCKEFASRQDAQEYFDDKGYSADNDPEELDRDNNGKACEERPSRPKDESDDEDSDSDSDSSSDEDSDDSRDEDSDDESSGDSDDEQDSDSDDSEDADGTSQVTVVPRGSVEAGG